jgi:hypothetical protein
LAPIKNCFLDFDVLGSVDARTVVVTAKVATLKWSGWPDANAVDATAPGWTR